ncbi:MAG: M43 family zinc metalloprotease [Bacteroidia bacterium]
MRKQLLSVALITALSAVTYAQNKIVSVTNLKKNQTKGQPQQFKKCGSVAPSAAWEADFQKQIEALKANQSKYRSAMLVNYTIPVVVHVIHSGTAVGTGANISDAQVNSQIQVLNDDYAGTGLNNANLPSAFASAKANTGVTFCMAQRTPAGAQMTTPGIDRISYSTKGFTAPGTNGYSTSYIDATIKPNTIWDPTQYLNVWVLDLDHSLLGYATFPDNSGLAGMPSGGSTATTDGFVNTYSGWGVTGSGNAPYNKGRTAVHEIGHWLGLRHIWGDASCGDDYCTDTPTQAGPNYGCPTYPSATCGNAGDMSMNFMDYTDDQCMYMFTNDQKTRVVTALTNDARRASIVNPSNLACTPVNLNTPPTAMFTASTTNTFVGGANVTLTNTTTNATTYAWTVSPTSGATLSSTTATSPTISFTAAGSYSVCLTATNSFGSSTPVCQTINVTATQPTTCDTLSNLEANDTLAIYRVGALASDGYVTGQNSYGDISKAERYDYPVSGFSTGLTISGLHIYHGVIKGSGSTAYNVWGETASMPGTVLGTKSVVNSTFTPLQLNTVTFTTPISITNNTPFYVGYTFGNVSGDTIAVVHTRFDNSTVNHAYEQFSDNSWHSFTESPASWGANVSIMVWPIVCPTTTVGLAQVKQNLTNNAYIFPNPNNGTFSVMLVFDEQTDATITVTDLLGKQIMVRNVTNVTQQEVALNLANAGVGTYLVTIKTNNGTTTKRVVVSE